MNTLNKHVRRYSVLLAMVVAFFTTSCDDEYKYTKESPNWLGDNIYATLKNDKRFTTYVKMLEKMDKSYVDVLSKTGSRTIFAPTDSAFNVFFQNNSYGIRSLDEMPANMIKTYLTFYTLKGAFVTSTLGTAENNVRGNCLRRYTTFQSAEGVDFETRIPKNRFFKRFQDKEGMYISTEGDWTLLNFTQDYFNKNQITNEDFDFFYPERHRQNVDTYIFDAKIIEGDITAQNGYIHVLDKVVFPPQTMYDYICDDEELTVFRDLLERFCRPEYDAEATRLLRLANPESQDSVFQVSFFDRDVTYIDENGNTITLPKISYSPAANDGGKTSESIGRVPNNMPAMLVPTNDAMNSYLENSFLSDYGSWDNVPDDIASKFVNTHMKRSFLNTLPTNIEEFIDDVKGDSMYLTKNNVLDAKICRNGAIYKVDLVVGPRDFITVVSPLYKNEQLKILNWLVNESYNNKELKFNYYLTSMENDFTLILPLDESFENYEDPYPYYKSGVPLKAKLRFRYYEDLKGVNFIYLNMDGDSIGSPIKPVFTNSSNTTVRAIKNRLKDILDYHIVVGQIDPSQEYVQTKGGAYIKIDRSGGKERFQGAGDIEKGEYVEVLEKYDVSNNIRNGTVYIVNKRINHTLKSVYAFGTETLETRSFFDLLQIYNDPDQVFTFKNEKTKFATVVAKQKEFLPPVFENKDGIDYVVPFLGLYSYTLFAPTNAALSTASAKGLFKSVSDIEAIDSDSEKIREIKRNILFLKNHFVDGGVFTTRFYQSSDASSYNWPITLTTSAKDTMSNKFHNMQVDLSGKTLIIKDEAGNNVAKTVSGSTDIMTRQYKFLNSGIGSNSRTIIHMIDNAIPLK